MSREDADYEGVRVQFRATLAGARIPMQIDVGFGDVVFPATTRIEYPTLLEFPSASPAGLSEGDGDRRETGSSHCTGNLEQPDERLLRPVSSLTSLSVSRTTVLTTSKVGESRISASPHPRQTGKI